MSLDMDDIRGDASDEIRAAAWRDLVGADLDRNAGMAMELISAAGYAAKEGVTRADYIVGVLRAERTRRQALDSIGSDRVLLDEVIDEALAKGIPVATMLAARFRTTESEISSHFMAQLTRRMQERLELK